MHYADYTLWQRRLLGAEDDPDSRLAQQAAYWRKTLAGLPDCISLPTSRPRPAVSSYQGATLPIAIAPGLHQKLRALARTSGASLFMILQAGLAILLSKLGAGEDIALGSPIAGRTDSALDELVGFFVNTLVLRIDLGGNPTVAALIERVRERSLGAYAHQDLPFERLVEFLNPARAQNHHPLFQVMLALQNNEDARLELPDLSVRYQPIAFNTAKFDLTFSLAENAAGLGGRIEYATDLFDAASVARLSARLVQVLEAIASDPARRVGEIDLLTAAERDQLLVAWNETAREVPETSLPALFEAQVARTPEATALVYETRTLSYAGLNEQANRLAHYLIGLGIGPEDRVALCLPRSLEMVWTLLGILKAGAAYIPLDPDYPAERLRFMLADAAPRAVITTAALAERELLGTGLAPLVLDQAELVAALDASPRHNPTDSDRIAPLAAEHPAYVIYTSGSTGTPKGVVVAHRGLRTVSSGRRPLFSSSGPGFGGILASSSTWVISTLFTPGWSANVSLPCDEFTVEDTVRSFARRLTCLIICRSSRRPSSLCAEKAVPPKARGL